MSPWAIQIVHAIFFLGGVNYCIDAIDFWLGAELKKRLRERTVNAWADFGSSDPLVVVQTPLRILSKCFDKICGEKIVSFRAFWRSSLVSTCILLSTLAVVGMFNGKPFGIDIYPWQTFDDYFGSANILVKSPQANKLLQQYLTAPEQFEERHHSTSPESVRGFKKASLTPPVADATMPKNAVVPGPTPWVPQTKEQALKAAQVAQVVSVWIKRIAAYDTPFWRVLYSVAFFIIVPLLNILMDFFCIAVARKIVREMIVARTLTTLLALIVFDLSILLVIYLISLLFICFLTYPLGAVVSGGLLILGLDVNIPFALTLMVPCVLVALWFGPVWIKVVSLNASLPTVILSLISLLSFGMFEFRVKIHRFITHALDLACQHEKGVLAFVKAILGGLVVVMAFVAKELGGFSR
jgi:hypothetical protein